MGKMPVRKSASRRPISLATWGHRFTGGQIDRDIEGSPMTGQLYIEYFVPTAAKSPFPIVMVHGGNQTGTNFTGTPDGREGWAQYFVRRGYTVYVVDQVARGRSAHWSQAQGSLAPQNLNRTMQRFVAPARSRLWPQAGRHIQWPGSGLPGDSDFEQFYASQFPSVADFSWQQVINRNALTALLDEIGPAILLTHSQGGAFAWPVADARPNLVKAIVAVEPNGPPVHDVDFKGPPDWFDDIGQRKASGLGLVPLTYDPPLVPGETLSFVQQAKPDAPDLVRCWLQQEPARQLVNIATVPIFILVAEASYHAAYDHCTAAYLTQAGVANTMVRLADIGIRGNGHMMMLEKNSDEIAGVIHEWLKSALPAGRQGRGTRRK